MAQNIARKLLPFGFTVVTYNPYVSASFMRILSVRKVTLEELLAEADVVNVICPHTPETHQLITAGPLGAMKPHAMLSNCARAKIVDNGALYSALTEGWIASAGVDDTEEEPAKLDHWFSGTIRSSVWRTV